MRFVPKSGFACAAAVCLAGLGFGQQTAPPANSTPAPATAPSVIRVQSSLVLVDVIGLDDKTGLPVRDFSKSDFRVYDNRREVPLISFDSGMHFTTRPVILWLAVICNEGGKIGGSREFVGKEALFRPALEYLDKHDSVGVAHWCDNGDTQLDLLPTENRDLPFKVLAETIKPIPFHIGGNSNFVGEETYRKMVRLILKDAQQRNPQPLPVIVFLDGDRTGQLKRELDRVVDDVLQTSGMVFGIRDQDSSSQSGSGPGGVANISHYMAAQTGGQYFTAAPKDYATALEMILVQLHFRYQLGFIPLAIDGKRHELKVELTKDSREKHKGVELRFRPEYIPVSEPPDWAR